MSLTPRTAVRGALPALLGLVALLAAPAITQAAPPDRTGTVTASAAAFAWDGAPGTGSYEPTGLIGGYDPAACSKEAENYCDITLVNVQSGVPVGLELAIGEYSDPTADFDLYLYRSDATGTVGEEIEAENDGPSPGFGPTGLPAGFDETLVKAALEPGYYLVVVAYFLTNDASYKGTFTVTGATPVAGGGTTTPPPSGGGGTTPPPSGGGGTTPPPSGGGTTTPPPSGGGTTLTTLPFKAASSLGSAKKAKRKKSLSFKATATEAITNLRLQLLDARKGNRTVYGKATIASFAKGTRTVKLKVNKRLKRGKYTLLATGTVNGKSLSIARSVKVKK